MSTTAIPPPLRELGNDRVVVGANTGGLLGRVAVVGAGRGSRCNPAWVTTTMRFRADESDQLIEGLLDIAAGTFDSGDALDDVVHPDEQASGNWRLEALRSCRQLNVDDIALR